MPNKTTKTSKKAKTTKKTEAQIVLAEMRDYDRRHPPIRAEDCILRPVPGSRPDPEAQRRTRAKLEEIDRIEAAQKERARREIARWKAYKQ